MLITTAEIALSIRKNPRPMTPAEPVRCPSGPAQPPALGDLTPRERDQLRATLKKLRDSTLTELVPRPPYP